MLLLKFLRLILEHVSPGSKVLLCKAFFLNKKNFKLFHPQLLQFFFSLRPLGLLNILFLLSNFKTHLSVFPKKNIKNVIKTNTNLKFILFPIWFFLLLKFVPIQQIKWMQIHISWTHHGKVLWFQILRQSISGHTQEQKIPAVNEYEALFLD